MHLKLERLCMIVQTQFRGVIYRIKYDKDSIQKNRNL